MERRGKKMKRTASENVVNAMLLPIVEFGPLFYLGCMISGAVGHPAGSQFVLAALSVYAAFVFVAAALAIPRRKSGELTFVFMTVFVSAYMTGMMFVLWTIVYYPVRWLVQIL
jgi:hypothetical protein